MVDLEKTADEYSKTVVTVDELGPSIKFVHYNIYINLLPATDAHKWRRYAIDHIKSRMWKSSHSSGESPTLSLELEKRESGCCHDLARLPMPTSGGGMP